MAEGERLHRTRHRHVKQPPFLIERAFRRRTCVRQQAILQSHDIDARKFQPLATVHGDERHGIASLRFLLAFAVEGDVLQKGLQPVGQRVGGPAKIVERGGQFAQVANAGLGVFGIFFQPLEFFEIAGFLQKMFAPGLQRPR